MPEENDKTDVRNVSCGLIMFKLRLQANVRVCVRVCWCCFTMGDNCLRTERRLGEFQLKHFRASFCLTAACVTPACVCASVAECLCICTVIVS